MYDMKDDPIDLIQAWIELHQSCFLILSSLLFLWTLIEVYGWMKTLRPYFVYLGAAQYFRLLQIGEGLFLLGLAGGILMISGVIPDKGYYPGLAILVFFVGIGMKMVCLLIIKRRYLVQ